MDAVGETLAEPEDVQKGWLKFSRRMQAALTKNHGYALVTVTIAAHKCNAVQWLPPKVELIEPSGIDVELTDEMFKALVTLMHSKNGKS